MAVLASPALNWLSSPEPQSASSIVTIASIQPATHLHMTQGILPAPNASSLAPEGAVGYSTAS